MRIYLYEDRKAHYLTTDKDSSESTNDEINEILQVNWKVLYTVKVTLDGAPLKMETDAGVAVPLISKTTHKKLWKSTTTRLRTYLGQHLVVLGTFKVKVQYKAKEFDTLYL